MALRTRIVRIGNSQGTRIPKLLLERSNLADEVELQAEDNRIIISSTTHPRQEWERAFRAMAERGEDSLVDNSYPHSNSMGRGRVGMVDRRFDVYLIDLYPTIGSEIQKTRYQAK